MKKSISGPVAIGMVVIFVVLVAVIGWRYMSVGPKDKNGNDLSAPAVQPANMADEMQRRMKDARGAGRPGGPAPAVPGGATR